MTADVLPALEATVRADYEPLDSAVVGQRYVHPRYNRQGRQPSDVARILEAFFGSSR